MVVSLTFEDPRFFQREILEMTPARCVNVHASLLPKYRGAAPVKWAVIDGGEKVSSVTLHADG